jgi:peptide/nickel transport system substrate-binding protein
MRRSLLAATAGAVAVLALAACSSNSGSSVSATSFGAAPKAASFVYVIAQDFANLDPAVFSSEATTIINEVRESTLLEYQADGSTPTSCADTLPPTTMPQSQLVQSWSQSANGKSINITLKSGVKSAAGNTLTSQDVKWSIDRMAAIDPVGKVLWFTLGGFNEKDPITIKSPTQFTLNVSKPSADTKYVLAGPWGLVFDSAAIKPHTTASDPWAKGWLATHTADFGPWQLKSYSQQQVTFSRNPNYTGKTGNIDTVVLKTVTDASARTQLLESGQAQLGNDLDFSQLAQLKSSKNVTITQCKSPSRDLLGLSDKDPILKPTKVRQAISMALNRTAIASAVYHGFATPATAGVSAAFDPTSGTSSFTYDPSKAKALLAQAGYPNGFPLTLTVSPSQPGPYSQDLAVLIQSQLRQIGITVSINTVASAEQFLSDGTADKMQAYIMQESPAFANAGYGAWLSSGCQGFQNYSGYCVSSFDNQAFALMDNLNDSKIPALMNQMSDLINSTLPAVYLVDDDTDIARASCVTSFPAGSFATYIEQAVSTCK